MNSEEIVMLPVTEEKKTETENVKARNAAKLKSVKKKLAKAHKTPVNEKVKKAHRFKTGTRVEIQIQRLRKSPGECFLKKQPFIRLLKSLAGEIKDNVKFEREAVELARQDASRQLDCVFGAANLVNVAENRETLDVWSFDLLNELSHLYPNCFEMFPPMPDRYETLRYLKNRLSSLGVGFRTIMGEIRNMNDKESCKHMREKIMSIIKKRLEFASIEFNPEADIAELETIYHQQYKKKAMKQLLCEKIKEAMKKNDNADEIDALALAYKSASKKK